MRSWAAARDTVPPSQIVAKGCRCLKFISAYAQFLSICGILCIRRRQANPANYGHRTPKAASLTKSEGCDMLLGACGCLPAGSSMSRRGLLCAGGAGFVTALIGTLASSSRIAQAQALTSNTPQVDSMAVRIVTKNQIIKWIPTEKRDGLTIERRPGGNLRPDAPPSVDLVAEWGLSMRAESHRGSEVRNVLIDFGYQPQTLLNNMSVLKIDPASFDALVLSH